MVKKRRMLFVSLLVMLCMVLLCAVGCSEIKVPNGGDGDGPTPEIPSGDRLAAVVQSSAHFEESASSLLLTWQAVPNATSYRLRITAGDDNGVSMGATVQEPSVDLRNVAGLKLPENGTITVEIRARAAGYTESLPTTITYELEGTLLLSPEITSFENGIMEWKNDAAASEYTVKVNGTVVVQAKVNTFDTSSVADKAKIEITAKIKGKDGVTSTVILDKTAGVLRAAPIGEYTLSGEILRWGEVGGAIGYKVVDLDFNAYTVNVPHYIMSIRNIVYGVYPVMASNSVVKSAEVAPADIKYLSGSGISADPYVINTPFDLRTIDYYELKYSENNGAKRNVYRIAADLDYNTVAALESESNIFTLRKPFFGTLDGNGKTLSNLSVNYKYGFWALFEYISSGATVKDITFDGVEINNENQDNNTDDTNENKHPINTAVATVAYKNNGTISNVTVNGAKYKTTAGGIAGIAIHNGGTVTGCTISDSTFNEGKTSHLGTAAYEMGGIVLENMKGGLVEKCTANKLVISGVGSNIGSTGGIVSINRAGATVKDNSYNELTVKNIKSGKEAGGVVAYCAKSGDVTRGTGTLGTLTVGSASITSDMGNASKPYGRLYGKKG